MPFVSPSLCYIRRMLLDHQLALETIAKPRSFIGFMCLYESNYFRLQQLIPEIERLDGYYQSCAAGDCHLHVEFRERRRDPHTLSLSYFFLASSLSMWALVTSAVILFNASWSSIVLRSSSSSLALSSWSNSLLMPSISQLLAW